MAFLGLAPDLWLWPPRCGVGAETSAHRPAGCPGPLALRTGSRGDCPAQRSRPSRPRSPSCEWGGGASPWRAQAGREGGRVRRGGRCPSPLGCRVGARNKQRGRSGLTPRPTPAGLCAQHLASGEAEAGDGHTPAPPGRAQAQAPGGCSRGGRPASSGCEVLPTRGVQAEEGHPLGGGGGREGSLGFRCRSRGPFGPPPPWRLPSCGWVGWRATPQSVLEA